MRDQGDAEADALMERIFQSGTLDAVSQTLRKLVENDDIPVTEMRPEIREYLQDAGRLPPWVDHDKLNQASAIFDIHGLQIVMMLLGASLPTLYAARKGAQVLVMTDRMVNYTLLQRRIVETAQFVMDVTDFGAFQPDGSGIVAVQKVRLIHATIRHLIRFDPKWKDQWDNEWGIPINQVDLAGTMLSFSTTVLQCMERSSIILTAQEKEAYLHLWKVIGYLLGIEEALMPRDYADSVDLMDTTLKLNHEASAAGQLLTKVLVKFLDDRIPFLHLVHHRCDATLGGASCGGYSGAAEIPLDDLGVSTSARGVAVRGHIPARTPAGGAFQPPL
ncbi:DUF2236 domain-containing protein [bacterium]|nr:DUF2236 domain-containing protein [bacterium]